MKTYVNSVRVQSLLYYFLSVIGLAPFSVRNRILRPVGFWSKVYAVILAILSSLWIYFVFLGHRARNIEISFANRFVFRMTLTLYGGNLWATLLVFAFKSNKMIDIINRIIAIKNEVKSLGTKDNDVRDCRNFYARIIATNSVICSLKIILDLANFDQNHDHGTAFLTLFWIGSITTGIHIHCAILIFVETMICIRKLFESLNEKLQDIVKANCDSLSLDEQWDSSVLRMGRNRQIANQSVHTITTQSENIELSVEDVEKIGKLHRELCDLVESVTNFHTVPLLFAIARYFSGILPNCCAMYAQLLRSHDVFDTTEAILPWIQQLVAQMAIRMLELFLITHASTSVSRVGNATKAMLHEVWNKYHPEELRYKLSKFSLQLLNKSIAVSAFGFFDLGYSCIYKIFCTSVAYFIIMIQLDTSKPNPRT